MQRVTCLIDIQAPCQEVFDTVVDLERRMQLSPLWGLNRVLEVAPNFPEPGSSYRVQLMSGQAFELPQETSNERQHALEGLSQALFLQLGNTGNGEGNQTEVENPEPTIEEEDQQEVEVVLVEHEYVIGEYEPPYKLSYYLDDDCETFVTWSFQSIPYGTRINYEEVFCDENVDDENFVSTVQQVVREWLANIKRYSELRYSRGQKVVKWFLDRFYLKLRPEQRRVVLILLYLQAIGLGTFMIAALGWGLVTLLS
jgi:hypothetical protein